MAQQWFKERIILECLITKNKQESSLTCISSSSHIGVHYMHQRFISLFLSHIAYQNVNREKYKNQPDYKIPKYSRAVRLQ